MSMVTSCPACTTTFRITPEQLQKRQGKVRCGRCSGVFDAFKSLATIPDEPIVEPSSTPAPEPEPEPERAALPPQQGLFDSAPTASEAPAAPAALEPARPARATRALWWVLIAALALVLFAQLVYAFRDRIAAAWPASRPLLERMCVLARCSVAWPERPDLLAIEASDLQADPAQPNILVLTATLRNRGNVDVARPALELTLTDSQDRMIARRILLPADYAPGKADASGPMPAMGEVEVRLELETTSLKPAGYRLFLFYP